MSVCVILFQKKSSGKNNKDFLEVRKLLLKVALVHSVSAEMVQTKDGLFWAGFYFIYFLFLGGGWG